MIDVQRLAVLREVAKQGSFNRAAATLHCTASAVSQQVAALERSLGAPVVERSTRGVTLTDAGRVLVEAADAIAAELADTEQRITRLTAERTALTVATFASGGRRLLPGALGGFVADHPEVELTILEAEPEDSLPAVREGRADLALAYHLDGPPPSRPGDRSGLDWTPLAADPLRVVLPRAHPLAVPGSTLHLAELADQRWILGCRKSAGQLARFGALAGVELRISCTATDYDFAQSLVRAGIGIALIPRIGLTDHPDLLSLPLAEPAPHRHLGLVLSRRRRGHRARLAEELAARLTAESATLAYTRTDGPASPQATPAR
ncbi:LysR family transcriptional regulator [Kitasatospora cheerisanensis]|uniref:LysR family transcriptional regulator n=1 Tax=Kitasatospora cheerisanensis KCTC 2395 TaxID=1348663 RepID=A0A066YMB7_9ACTN|nr:LysR family transcriptional regulator [Kitasatospora cheerisanensis]KDN81079.1 LysR family transcriptional regulator [Kitasatospora cheerisanensis KCTC 2395]